MLLEHVEQAETAERIRDALRSVIVSGTARTRDMGGDAGTEAFTGAVVEALS